MTERVKPDGTLPKWKTDAHDGLTTTYLGRAPAFLRSTILAAIDEEIAWWGPFSAVFIALRARFEEAPDS